MFGIEFLAGCAVRRKKRFALRLQILHQLIFCIFNVFQTAEGFQMLVADAGQKPVLRMHNLTQLFDLPAAPRAHFADKHLVFIL